MYKIFYCNISLCLSKVVINNPPPIQSVKMPKKKKKNIFFSFKEMAMNCQFGFVRALITGKCHVSADRNLTAKR